MGVQLIEFDGGSADLVDFNNLGLDLFAEIAGIALPAENNLPAMGPADAFVLGHVPVPGDPPPCRMLDDGIGIYVSRGNPLMFPFHETTFVCPGRHPAYYHATPVPGTIPEPEQTVLLSFMRLMRRHGMRTVQFDATTMQAAPYDRIGLEGLAARAGLSVPGLYGLPLGRDDTFMLRVPRAAEKKGAPPCRILPDGTGLYVELWGYRGVPPKIRDFYCPLNPPPRSHASPAGG